MAILSELPKIRTRGKQVCNVVNSNQLAQGIMKSQLFTNGLKTGTVALGLLCLTAQGASANPLNGVVFNVFLECLNDGVVLQRDDARVNEYNWQYAIDPTNDGSGGSKFEMFGMGVRETQDSVWVVLNGNTPLAGVFDSAAADDNIGWGDLFFNLNPTTDFQTASGEGSLYGVRFAGTNDSGVSEVGLYGNVTAQSVTGANHGYASLNAYDNAIASADLGDMNADGYLDNGQRYYQGSSSLNTIASGTFLSGINWLSEQELADGHFDSSLFGGSKTIAFSFNKSSVFGEPEAATQSVPEPSSLIGLAFLGLSAFGVKRHKKQSSNC